MGTMRRDARPSWIWSHFALICVFDVQNVSIQASLSSRNLVIGRREEVYRRNGDSEILNLDIENEDGGGKFRESDIGR